MTAADDMEHLTVLSKALHREYRLRAAAQRRMRMWVRRFVALVVVYAAAVTYVVWHYWRNGR